MLPLLKTLHKKFSLGKCKQLEFCEIANSEVATFTTCAPRRSINLSYHYTNTRMTYYCEIAYCVHARFPKNLPAWMGHCEIAYSIQCYFPCIKLCYWEISITLCSLINDEKIYKPKDMKLFSILRHRLYWPARNRLKSLAWELKWDQI